MYHVIANGANSDGKKAKLFEQVRATFENAGKQVEFHFTNHPKHATEIVKELTSKNEQVAIIAMGGDGTLHEVLNGIADFEKCTLGLIPVGTGNDFADANKISSNAVDAANDIINNTPKAIDFIELSNGLRSINSVGTGIDVDVLKCVYASKHSKRNKYFKAFLKTLHNFKCTQFKASWDDGEEKEYNGMIACVANSSTFGGGIKLFPTAKIDDGLLDLIIVNYISRVRLVFAFIKLMTGKAHKIKEATYVKCKSVKFIPKNEMPTIQAEGELYDNTPLEAHVVSGKLKFYLPKI